MPIMIWLTFGLRVHAKKIRRRNVHIFWSGFSQILKNIFTNITLQSLHWAYVWLQIWQEYIERDFEPKYDSRADEVDLKVSFESKRHGDGEDFDGQGPKLGHAFFPDDERSGMIHLDDDEAWVPIGGEEGKEQENIWRFWIWYSDLSSTTI